MHNDNWTDKTIPTRPVEPGGKGAGPKANPAIVWILGGIVALMLLVVCGLWALYLLRGQVTATSPTPTLIIWTPTVAPTIAITPTSAPTEVAEPTPTISPGVAIGRYVEVVGTGGYGLSLRAGPGENYTRMDVALEGEIFVVVDGPTAAGDSEWWKIQDRENVEREWWAVGNFLEPIEHP
jgi:hypothetical protein